MLELVLQELCFTVKVLDVSTEKLAKREVLVKRRAHLVLALEDVAEARGETNFASAVEHNLRASYVRVCHVLLVQVDDWAENLTRQVLQYTLWQGSNRLDQVV